MDRENRRNRKRQIFNGIFNHPFYDLIGIVPPDLPISLTHYYPEIFNKLCGMLEYMLSRHSRLLVTVFSINPGNHPEYPPIRDVAYRIFQYTERYLRKMIKADTAVQDRLINGLNHPCPTLMLENLSGLSLDSMLLDFKYFWVMEKAPGAENEHMHAVVFCDGKLLDEWAVLKAIYASVGKWMDTQKVGFVELTQRYLFQYPRLGYAELDRAAWNDKLYRLYQVFAYMAKRRSKEDLFSRKRHGESRYNTRWKEEWDDVLDYLESEYRRLEMFDLDLERPPER